MGSPIQNYSGPDLINSNGSNGGKKHGGYTIKRTAQPGEAGAVKATVYSVTQHLARAVIPISSFSEGPTTLNQLRGLVDKFDGIAANYGRYIIEGCSENYVGLRVETTFVFNTPLDWGRMLENLEWCEKGMVKQVCLYFFCNSFLLMLVSFDVSATFVLLVQLFSLNFFLLFCFLLFSFFYLFF